MGTSQRTAFIYLLTGVFFTYVAHLSVEDHIWNPTTLILIAVASLSFGASLQIYMDLFQHKRKKDE